MASHHKQKLHTINTTYINTYNNKSLCKWSGDSSGGQIKTYSLFSTVVIVSPVSVS